MSRNWLSPGLESSLLDEVAFRRQRLAAMARSVQPRMAGLAASYADAYPWMEGSAVSSMVQAGVSPDTPQAVAIADLAAQQAAEDGELDNPADDVPDAWYETLWNAATGWAKPIVRTGFTILATPVEELDALLSAAGTALFDETEAGEFGLAGDDDPNRNFDLARNLGSNIGAVLGEFGDLGDLVSDFWTNYTSKAARSGGLLALGDLLQGKHVDLGEGFLPGGEIWEEREAAKQRLQLDGHFVTPGRLLSRVMTGPGSTPYQMVSGTVDFAKQIADPSALALGKVSKAAEAYRTFQATGVISGIRKTVDVPTAVNHYLTGQGREFVSWATKTSDAGEIWRATGRGSVDVARRLAASTDESETFGILSDVLGTVIREKPTAGFVSRRVGGFGGNEYGKMFGGGARVRRSVDNSRVGFLNRLGRLAGDVPAQSIGIDDLDDAAYQLDLWMSNAQMSREARNQAVARLSALQPGDQVGVLSVVEDVMSDAKGLLVQEWGVAPSQARRMTSLWGDYGEDLMAYDFDDVGRHVDVLAPLRGTVEGVTVDVRPLPGMVIELVDDVIPLPGYRDIRRATPAVKRLKKLYDSGLWQGSVDGMEAAMSTVWKPLQLLRGAYTARVIFEEQMRMAGAGYDSLIRHPMSAIAWSLSIDPKSRLGRKLADAARKFVDPKGTETLLGGAFDDIAEHMSALSRGSAGHRGFPGEVLTGRYIKGRKGEGHFYRGWATELAHEANDPVMRRVAGGLKIGDLRSIGREASSGNNFDDVAEWFWSGSGQTWRKKLGRIEGRSALLTDPDAARAYLRQNYLERLERFTGGNSELVELVAKGRLGDDINLRGFGHENKLARLLEEGYDGAAPNFVKVPEWIANPSAAKKTADRLNKGIERGFESLMSRPTNWLSRSPVFRQKYYQRVEEVIGSASREIQESVIRQARAANVGDDALARMASKVLAGEGTKLTAIEDIDDLAKAYALSETKKLLYDLQKRSQVFSMMAVVFPFGEAWKEIIGSWSRIVRQNPQTLRRFQQTLDGARQPSVLGEAETDPGSGQGFFHTDPQTGEEVFTYPAGWVGELLGVNEGGAGLSMTGRVAGLNIVSATVLPGFGPAIQIPASKLIPNTPRWDTVKEMISPFGETEGVLDSFTPAWVDKLQTAFEDPENHRMFGNTVADVQRALLRTGNYDLSTSDGQQRLNDDAISKARILYVIRGLAQSTVPTGPSLSWTTADVEGNVVPMKLLSDELRRLTDEEYGGDRTAAFTEWVRRFGVDNVLAVVGKSTELLERPVTEKGDAWLRAHPSLEEDFPLAVGYFAPEPAVGEFDYTAYLRQFETNSREAVTPAEQLALANDFLGRIQWEQAKRIASVRPGPVTAMFLAQVRSQIAEAYPGFDGWVSEKIRAQRPTPEMVIDDMRKAVENPTIASTDAGKGVLKYLSAIDAAKGMVNVLPGNVRHYQQAKSAAPIRAWLRSVAREVITEHPDFARVWFDVFDRELAEDAVTG